MDAGFDAERRRPGSSRALTVAAFATLIVAPLVPAALMSGTPAALLSLPAESIAVVLILLCLPPHPARAVLAGAFGAIVVVASTCAGLDLAFGATVDRAFSATEDWRGLVSAFGVVADAAGLGSAIIIAVLVVALLVAATIAIARAALRVAHVTVGSGRPGRVGAATVSAVWILGLLAGAQLWPGTPLAASAATDALVATSARTGMSIQEQQAFERALESDGLALRSDELLGALEGKDVVIAFLESYGRVALEGPEFSAGVDRVLQQGGAQLARDGYGAQSAFLTSPTFGGVSWLAHATLQSGVWVDSQQKHDGLMATDRATLSRVFGDAGWRTVAVVPSNHEEWDAGTAFYEFDAVLDSRNLGYRGPAFGYARMPDQYTWQRFYDRELAGASRPLMAEIDFVSSHTPWTPLPSLVPWSEVGDGSVFDPQVEGGTPAVVAWS
ncbi:MAG: CDP-alcohol phosphatidyltransferase, partial [Microbacterium sp.]